MLPSRLGTSATCPGVALKPVPLSQLVVNLDWRLVHARKALLQGLSPTNNCGEFMHRNFSSFRRGEISIERVVEFRDRGICIVPMLDEDGHLEKLVNLARLKSLLPITAVVMAGGRGRRLRPLTSNCPKPMLPVGERPILEVNIRRLVAFGIEDIYISVNYLREQITEYFGDGSAFGCRIQYITEDEPRGTMGALSLVPSTLSTSDVLLMNADLLSDIDLEAFYLHHRKTKSQLTVASVPHNVEIPYAILEHDGNTVLQFSEKPTYTYLANAGFYLFRKELLKLVPGDQFYDATDFMSDVLSRDLPMSTFRILGYWNDVGSLNDYDKAQRDVLNLKL